MIRLIKLITFAVTIICTGLVLYNLFTKDQVEAKQNFKSNQPIFRMEIGHDEWNGKLEPGKYTKSGILIIKQ